MTTESKKTLFALQLAEKGLLPDSLIRSGIRKLCHDRLREIADNDCERTQSNLNAFIEQMQLAEIAPLPDKANAQHYEIPAAFYQYCLGTNRKYSSCFWLPDTQTLDQAEHLALAQTCSHARLGGASADTGTRMRLGFFNLVDGQPLPGCPYYGCFKLSLTA